MSRKFRTIGFLVLLAMLLAGTPVPAEESLSSLVARIKPAVVFISVYDSKGEITIRGTGFFINETGSFVTNRHVLYGGTRVKVETSDGRQYSIKGIQGQDREGDLVIAQIDAQNVKFPHLKISAEIPQVGDRIIVVGNPLGLEFSVSDGLVSAFREIPGSVRVIQITAPISPGSSGSPVLNTKGEVVGVATFQLLRGQNLNFAIPAERIGQIKLGTLQAYSEWSSGRSDTWEQSAEGLYHKGLTHILADDYEAAVNFLKQAVQKNPRYAEAYFKLGYSYGQLKRYNEALQAFSQVLKLRPRDADAIYNLGVIYGRMNKTKEAVAAYKQVLQLNSRYVQAYYNLGIIYGQEGKLEESIDMLKKAVELKPDYGSAFYNLGVSYGKMEKYENAITSYKQAIRINPDDASSHYNLGIAYDTTGDKASALQEYKILKSLNREMADKLFDKLYK